MPDDSESPFLNLTDLFFLADTALILDFFEPLTEVWLFSLISASKDPGPSWKGYSNQEYIANHSYPLSVFKAMSLGSVCTVYLISDVYIPLTMTLAVTYRDLI
jgi:hypothetical protein